MSGTDGVVQKKPAVIPGEPPPLNVAGDAGDDTRHHKTKAIDDALKDHVENEGPVIKQSMEFLRLRTKKFMATSIMGTAWDVSFLVLSCISGFAFIRSTYLPPRPSEVDDKNLKHQVCRPSCPYYTDAQSHNDLGCPVCPAASRIAVMPNTTHPFH